MKNAKKNQKGFTMVEIMVSLSLFVAVIFLTGSMFSLSQKSYSTGSNESELSQNVRVALDRMSREIRQSVKIITTLPATGTDPLNPPSNEIFFQDGHNVDEITYIRYYLNGPDLMRAHEAYYFPADPGVYVIWDSLNEFGETPTQTVLEDRIIGEYFNNVGFWGDQGLIHMQADLEKNNKQLQINTSIFSRN